jgi:hypothetical protein
VSLHTGRIKDLGLDVVPDALHHANIKGLPSKEEADSNEELAAKREHFANRLREQCRPLWYSSKMRPKR